jgi:hypothetical protein
MTSYHVAPRVARESIERYGIDYLRGRSGTNYALVGSTPANYFWRTEREALNNAADKDGEWDVWEADLSGVAVEADPIWTECLRTTEPVRAVLSLLKSVA